jgi:hypothetical protein
MESKRDGLQKQTWFTEKDQEKTKAIEPFAGGNERLHSLHHIDIMRKHRRLLPVHATPKSVQVIGWGLI